MTLIVRMLGQDDGPALEHVAPEVFDGPVDPGLTAEVLSDARHHLAAALHAGQVVGIASGVHYVHPDKAPQLFINEVSVAPDHRGSGVGRRLLETLLAHASDLGCTEAWVLTDDAQNAAAHALYSSLGGEPAPDGSVAMYTFRMREGGNRRA